MKKVELGESRVMCHVHGGTQQSDKRDPQSTECTRTIKQTNIHIRFLFNFVCGASWELMAIEL